MIEIVKQSQAVRGGRFKSGFLTWPGEPNTHAWGTPSPMQLFSFLSSLCDEDITNMHTTKAQAKIEFKAQSTLKSDLFPSPVRTAGAGLTKTNTQATYRLRFGCSTYQRKAKEIIFPIQVVPYQNTLGVDGNRRNNMMTRICLDATMPFFGPEGLVRPRVARPPPWAPP